MAVTRRTFVTKHVSCACHLALAAAAMPLAARKVWAAESLGTMVAKEEFATLQKISDGVWALVSTPLTGNRTTLSNGGIIAGRDGVLAIEAFQTPEGALWMAGKAKELTGKWPTHVALTHYHSDHANGVGAYLTGGNHPVIRATARTRDLALERNTTPPDPSRAAAVNAAVLLAPDAPTSLDLGGRVVRLIPRAGHTESDVSVELDDPSIVFCGDLVWNAMFPNFVDTLPTEMISSIRALKRTRDTLYVPGHGPLARPADIDRYLAMHEEVERMARKAHAAGISAADAAKTFTLPDSVGAWGFSNPANGAVFHQRALEAWYKELKT